MQQMQLQETIDLIFPPRPGFMRTTSREEQWIPAGPAATELDAALALLRQVQPQPDQRDVVWPPVWLRVEREAWADVAATLTPDEDYDRETWELDYPYPTDWLGVNVSLIDRLWYVYHQRLPAPFLYDAKTQKVAEFLISDECEVTAALQRYLVWLSTSLCEQLTQFLADPVGYNACIEANLPNRERIGRIRRRDLWRTMPGEDHFLRDELHPEEVEAFARLAPMLVETKPLQPLTRDDYLRFCAICYAGAGYADIQGLNPRAQYEKHADGRHDGLLDLPGHSADALAEWFTTHPRGGHPWEIARGGNSTHISLFLVKEESQYTLHLEGSSRTRAAETIRMALALAQAGVPFSLRDADYLAKMAQGHDWIGIVPRDASSYFAAQLFSSTDEVRDVLAYSAIADYPAVEHAVQWYPAKALHQVSCDAGVVQQT